MASAFTNVFQENAKIMRKILNDTESSQGKKKKKKGTETSNVLHPNKLDPLTSFKHNLIARRMEKLGANSQEIRDLSSHQKHNSFSVHRLHDTRPQLLTLKVSINEKQLEAEDRLFKDTLINFDETENYSDQNTRDKILANTQKMVNENKKLVGENKGGSFLESSPMRASSSRISKRGYPDTEYFSSRRLIGGISDRNDFMSSRRSIGAYVQQEYEKKSVSKPPIDLFSECSGTRYSKARDSHHLGLKTQVPQYYHKALLKSSSPIGLNHSLTSLHQMNRISKVPDVISFTKHRQTEDRLSNISPGLAESQVLRASQTNLLRSGTNISPKSLTFENNLFSKRF